MSSNWDALVSAFRQAAEKCKFGQTLPQLSYYTQTQQVVLQFDGVSESHDEGDFMDRVSSPGDFWTGGPGPSGHWPATPTPTELDDAEPAHRLAMAAIGAMGQVSQSIPIQVWGTSPWAPAGDESGANAWQWSHNNFPQSIVHPDHVEWHISSPGNCMPTPARWVWEQMHQGRSEDDMRSILMGGGANAKFAELCLSRITWLQLQGRKTAPKAYRKIKWTRNTKDEVWALHALRARVAFPGRPMAIEGCMNMLLGKPVAQPQDYYGDVHNVQYVSTFMELSHITLSNIIYILIM